MSSKTIFGNRKTTNLRTGKKTKTYKSIIPGKSTTITRHPGKKAKISKRYNPGFSILGTRVRFNKHGVSLSTENTLKATTYNTGTKTIIESYKTPIDGITYQKKK